MKRINPEQVKEAYQKTGLRPIRGEWGRGGDGCAMTALTLAGGSLPQHEFPITDSYLEYASETLGVTREYAAAFISGFDYGAQPAWAQTFVREKIVPASPEGFTDGQLAALAVFGGLLDPEPEKVSA